MTFSGRDAFSTAICSPGSNPPRSARPSASAAETEQVTALLLEALSRSGYLNPVTAVSSEEKVRRLVRRLRLGARDVPVLLGMLRQILWKLNQ